MKLILLGVPGAGKGTQAEILSRKLNIPTVSTGNIIRNAISEKTPAGIQASAYVESGALVPDAIVVDMLKEYLSVNGYVDGYILDGFPRTIAQAQTLEDMGIRIDLVICLHLGEETVLQRLDGRRVCKNCGSSYHLVNKPPIKSDICDICGGPLIVRKDDAPETVLERLRVYYSAMEPLVDYYTAKGILRTVDGSHSIEQITEDILGEIATVKGEPVCG